MNRAEIKHLEHVTTAEHLHRLGADPGRAVAVALEPLLALYAALGVQARRLPPFAAEAFLAEWREYLVQRLDAALVAAAAMPDGVPSPRKRG